MTTGAMLRYPSMSIKLPQWMSDAPAAPDASSFDGSTVRRVLKPVAAEYIKPAVSSKVTVATAKAIATRPEVLVLLSTFPGGGESLRLEFRLRDVGGRAALRGTRGILGLLIGGKQQHHHGAVRVLEDLPGRLEAVDAGKVDVHQHQVRVQRLAGIHRSLAGLGFGNHLEAVRRLDDRTRGLAEGRLVVDNQDSHCHVSR